MKHLSRRRLAHQLRNQPPIEKPTVQKPSKNFNSSHCTPGQAGPPKAPKQLSSSSRGSGECSNCHDCPEAEWLDTTRSNVCRFNMLHHTLKYIEQVWQCSHMANVMRQELQFFALTLQGPFSVNIARIDEHPGPPVSLSNAAT